MVALLAAMVLSGQKTSGLSPSAKQEVIQNIGSVLNKLGYAPNTDFHKWKTIAANHKREWSDAKTNSEFAAAINTALSEFKVSHLLLSDISRDVIFPRKKIWSFGFTSAVVKNSTYVTNVFAGTEAERGGLAPGVKLTTFNFPNYPDTDSIELGYEAGGGPRTLIVHKEQFLPIRRTTVVWGNESTCVLVVPSLMTGYDPKEVEQLIVNAQHYPNLLIDMRNSTGGRPDFAMHLLGAFLPAGTRVGAAIRPDMPAKYHKETGKPATDRVGIVQWAKSPEAMTVAKLPVQYKGHIAVLVNGNTGSASEVVVQALRDYALARIFGSPTAGAVLFANGCPVGGGFILYFPWRDHWTAKGQRIEGVGVKPDVSVDPDSDEAGPLPWPLRKLAIEWLEKEYPPKKG